MGKGDLEISVYFGKNAGYASDRVPVSHVIVTSRFVVAWSSV